MSAAVTALSLDAAYCRDYSGAGLPIEAEEGRIRGVALEAVHQGFTGWGYLAAWGSQGQGVDLRLAAPEAGSYRVTFRYAAEAGATRSAAIDGAPVTSELAFESTGSWQRYATTELSISLRAGENLLSLDYDSGNSGLLNLDHVALTR
jgi:hypothetical protein